jgi:hypothetical protein
MSPYPLPLIPSLKLIVAVTEKLDGSPNISSRFASPLGEPMDESLFFPVDGKL